MTETDGVIPGDDSGQFTLETRTPFDAAPAWRELGSLINGKKLMALRDAPTRTRLIEEAEHHSPAVDLDRLIVCPSGTSLAAEAQRRGISAAAAYIELQLESNGELVCQAAPTIAT